MRRIALLLAVLTVGALALTQPPAQAAPVEPVVTIALATDGGPPLAVVLQPQTKYDLQCRNPSCAFFYRFDGGTQAATCGLTGTGYDLPTSSQAAVANNEVFGGSFPFDSAGSNRLKVAAVDAGEPRCFLRLNGRNVIP